MNITQLAENIKAGDRRSIAKALTLVESEIENDRLDANKLVERIYSPQKNCKKIAISGVPGVGKSTLIEAFGSQLIKEGMKIAVLAVDPSSPVTGGSILGDKTRMETLSASDMAFVRPSPSKGTMGGITKSTREACIIFEAAGFDYIFIETVGVGQSETLAHSIVDCFIMLHLPNSGDELQGIKKGITELADLIVVHKADKDNLTLARAAKTEQLRAASLYHKSTPVILVSSTEKSGLEELQIEINKYFESGDTTESLRENRRLQQNELWFQEELAESFSKWIRQSPATSDLYKNLLQDVITGKKAASTAATKIISTLRTAE